MAGDSEKRFQKIMDKLYHVPKPNLSLASGHGIGQLARGKRPEVGSRRSFEKGSRLPASLSGPTLGPAPQCRPWDRGDLMRRLSTFKAMTWFGKPKAISPINCARRGWINVEMDIIVCEACGARLLFSTPSSWTFEQVEKAAAVFSLKLDNGHKLVCPWIDNTCDETLARFPPTPPAALVKDYIERSSLLLKLTALPVISDSAIDYMRSPRLEKFLSQPCLPIILNNGFKLADDSGIKDLAVASEAAAADEYYQHLQSQKVISLCGWEPRVLPYVVDREDQSTLSAKSLSSSESSAQVLGQGKGSITVYYSSHTNELQSGKNNHPLFSEYQYDPGCIVLDCKFCGACVGLWAFATTQRPLEFFRLFPDLRGEDETSTCSPVQYTKEAISDSAYDRSNTKGSTSGLSLTIAGGPSPTKQSFKPRITFPIISRHLRSEFGPFPSVESIGTSAISSRNQVSNQFLLQNGDSSQYQMDINGHDSRLEGLGSLKRKRSEDKEEKINECARNEEKTRDIKGKNHNVEEIHSLHEDGSNIKSPKEVMTNFKDFVKDAFNEERNIDDNNTDGEILHTNSNAKSTIKISEAREDLPETGLSDPSNPGFAGVSGLNPLHNDGPSENGRDSNETYCSDTNRTLSSTQCVESENGSKGFGLQIIEVAENSNQRASGNISLASNNNNNNPEDAGHESRNNPKQLVSSKTGGFDPIRQHRPFCPWIGPEDGTSIPGWRLMLSALVAQQDKGSSNPSQLESPSTMVDDEMDDPIVSIRKLFMSPPSKRLKGAP